MANTATLTAFQIEGNLIAPDLTSELLKGEIKGQIASDFGLKKTEKLEDEIAFAWGEAKDLWNIFQRRLQRDNTDTATTPTREYLAIPLLKLLGYHPVYQQKAEVVESQTYAISHRAETGEEKPPIHIVGCRVSLDKRPQSDTPRLSAHALMQEYLNRTEYLWGVVTNGFQWRLLRDSSLMTRSAYIEFDLKQILDGENFAEFRLFYRLFHRSRLPQSRDDADKCLLEFYHQEGQQQGNRVRDRLRDGVEEALVLLGTGFLQHPQSLINIDGNVPNEGGFYRQLLLLIYRLLFLMVAESRNLLLVGEDEEKARIYTEYYSISRLRNLAERPSYQREGYQDIWQGLRMTFALFDENWRGKLLGLSPLNGNLFGSDSLLTLDKFAIDNYDLLKAIRNLSLYEEKGQQRRVNYGALDVEELGSVYESLLDFSPKIIVEDGIYQFALITGTERKTTGSYYTPKELVAQLIKSALEPVIKEKINQVRSRAEALLEEDGTKVQLRAELRAKLLSIKVCDPACGSGHFLLAAARRLGKELAQIMTGEAQPTPENLRLAIRDVIQNCIYGVDLNPLAVDLCKVALWIEGFCAGKPLNFLDHRIKCGNSLVGVLDIDCLNEGIPDHAFSAVTGDDKKLATQFKKRNKKEKHDIEVGQLALNFLDLEAERNQYVEAWRELGKISDETTDDVKEKQRKYLASHSQENKGWWRDFSACNLWTTAFFMYVTKQNLELLPTTAVLNQLLKGNQVTKAVVDAANKLGEKYRFFHWFLEFPEVFEDGGFDCVLGNPPWERIKLQEKEFFAARDKDIANAKNKAERGKLIKQLAKNNPQLLEEFEDTKHFADAQSKFIRESARFPLTAVGDINTYAVFAETTRKLISSSGRVGVIVPTGIATDATCQKFFGDLTQKQNLASFYDFENREKLFAAVDSRIKFSLLSMSIQRLQKANLSFFLTQAKQVGDLSRVFQLSAQDIALLNPNTLTCPIFRTHQDAELTKKIYQRTPVLENEKTGVNPWSISFMSMFHMANDSGLFQNEAGNGLVPLYEGKMVQAYDHRAASSITNTDNLYRSGQPLQTNLEQHQNINYTPISQYFVSKIEVYDRIANKTKKKYLLSLKSVTSSTNERTIIASMLPICGVSHSMNVVFIQNSLSQLYPCILGNFNSLILDFIAKQKVGGVNLSYFILKQLPVIPPEDYTDEDINYISTRVLELVYTADDMKLFALDMGYKGDPFIWNPQRRAQLRAELDAYYAKLYGLERDELRYILDPTDIYGEDFPSETFRVLKNKEIKEYGEYRTQRLVLEAFDRLKIRS